RRSCGAACGQRVHRAGRSLSGHRCLADKFSFAALDVVDAGVCLRGFGPCVGGVCRSRTQRLPVLQLRRRHVDCRMTDVAMSATSAAGDARFRVVRTDPCTSARTGRLTTGHGVVETPVFMPVATQGTVKGLTSDQIESLGAKLILANAYHLAV